MGYTKAQLQKLAMETSIGYVQPMPGLNQSYIDRLAREVQTKHGKAAGEAIKYWYRTGHAPKSLLERAISPIPEGMKVSTGTLPISGGSVGSIGKVANLLKKSKTLANLLKKSKTATAPVTAKMLKEQVISKASQLIEKPTRTLLPYVTAGGLLSTAFDIGNKKEEKMEQRGKTIGDITRSFYTPNYQPAPKQTGIPPVDLVRGLKSSPGPTGVPPIDVWRKRSMVLGQPALVEPQLVRSWSTGTTMFGVDIEGRHWVLTKKGWKRYSPRKPIVIGTKNLTPNKLIQAVRKYERMHKDLDKIFKKVRYKRRKR